MRVRVQAGEGQRQKEREREAESPLNAERTRGSGLDTKARSQDPEVMTEPKPRAGISTDPATQMLQRWNHFKQSDGAHLITPQNPKTPGCLTVWPGGWEPGTALNRRRACPAPPDNGAGWALP